MKAGKTVVMDRYSYSGIAYGVAKGLPLQWCKNTDKGLPSPDIVILMDLDVELSKKRGNGYNSSHNNNNLFGPPC